MSIDTLFARRQAATTNVSAVDDEILNALGAQWDDWKRLQQDIQALTSYDNVSYSWEEGGGMEAWIHSYAVTDVPERERPYFDDYLANRGLRADYRNDVLLMYVGDDMITVTDRDEVYEGRKFLFSCRDYTDAKTAWLIERHMERQGCYPGVFRTDRHDNIFPWSTTLEESKHYDPATDEEEEP